MHICNAIHRIGVLLGRVQLLYTGDAQHLVLLSYVKGGCADTSLRMLALQGHVGIKPKRGDGLLFWSFAADGKTADHASMHEGWVCLT